MTLNEFLVWLASSGGASAVASWILERIPQYTALQSAIKQWVYFASCVVLTLASYLTLTYVPAEILSQIAPYFYMIGVIFASVFLGTGFHRIDRLQK